MTKFLLLLALVLTSMVESSLSAEHQITEQRKNARQSSNNPTSLNSLTSSQDGIAKPQLAQQQQAPSAPITYARQTSSIPEFSANGQPQSTVYTHIQSGQQPATAQGYIVSVNAQQPSLTPGPTPVIMQYLPPNQPSGAIQYLQLIPTRPLIVPISPYISPISGYNTGSSQSAITGGSQSQYAPTSAYTQPSQTYSGSYNNNPSIQTPIGGYSTPVVTYFRPHTGIQLVNGPVDMSLNTNEYIPIQAENKYNTARP